MSNYDFLPLTPKGETSKATKSVQLVDKKIKESVDKKQK